MEWTRLIESQSDGITTGRYRWGAWRITIESTAGALRLVRLDEVAGPRYTTHLPPALPNDLPDAARFNLQSAATLLAWLEGRLPELPTVPYEFAQGSDLMRQAWKELSRIPRGKVITYGELARRLGRPPGAARSMGQACAKNPIPFFIPCHRVVREGGHLGGYAFGLELKRTLLEREGVNVEGEKVAEECLVV